MMATSAAVFLPFVQDFLNRNPLLPDVPGFLEDELYSSIPSPFGNTNYHFLDAGRYYNLPIPSLVSFFHHLHRLFSIDEYIHSSRSS